MRIFVILALACATTVVHADPKPWAQDVSQDRQDRANVLFEEGNALFAVEAHAPALAKYREAIALWDHPTIRLNMAVTLIRLDRILEADDALRAALRYDKLPFTEELYKQAKDYQRLVGKQVGSVEVSCVQPRTQVLLDGNRWFTCPGTQQRRVLAGEHLIVGERAGFVPHTNRLVVVGGATARSRIELVPVATTVKLVYRWPRVLPWATIGVGGAITFGGLSFWFAGRNQMDRFEAAYARECSRGCPTDLSGQPLLGGEEDSAKLKGKVAIGMFVVGGALAVGGGVWAIANRPRRVMSKLEVTPAPGGVSATLRLRF